MTAKVINDGVDGMFEGVIEGVIEGFRGFDGFRWFGGGGE